MYIQDGERIPIKIWAGHGEIEEGAIQQITNVANLPSAFHHVVLLSDAHQGYGMPIGGVATLKNAISPNMVGVDIGCGMKAVRTNLVDITKNDLKKIMSGIRKAVPVGFNHRKKARLLDMPGSSIEFGGSIVEQEFRSAAHQIGTLGGGNHFIEIQKGDDNRIWIMVHSGSRNIGFRVANYYNKIAKELNAKWSSDINPKWDLAFLPADSEVGTAYLDEMNYCLDFAKANRGLMMSFIKDIFNDVISCVHCVTEIDIHHNYATRENHFSQNAWVHRKGATSAKEGEVGVIPGSQGTSSYIVEGLGNEDSFMSCSHGAGRVMSRKKAKETLKFKDVVDSLDKKGILHSIRAKSDLDEAPQAYKNIDTVMAYQTDLVKIKVKLTPLAVIKG